MQVLILSPEAPYPLNGGGAYRTASLLHYFAGFAEVDLLQISESGAPALLPPGLVRRQQVIPLARHSSSTIARYLRNASRAFRGVPPLIDRLSGLDRQIENALQNRRYDLALVEHFWCAPYLGVLERHCTTNLLDLHNVESVLHATCASVEMHSLGERLIRAGHRRFAAASRRLEAGLLPRYTAVLATSEIDAVRIGEIAPSARVHVYPNALPFAPVPQVQEERCLVFPANFEYHPNIDAVHFFISEIWPLVRRAHPDLRLRLVGRGDGSIRHLLPRGSADETGIEVTGPVDDARTEIARATVVVAPLRAGSGTRIKILEAWAAQRAIVATPLAAEGLEVKDGTNIAVESTPAGFADRISTLLNNTPLRQRLAEAGRRMFEDHYCWERVWSKLDIDLQLTRLPGLNRYTGIS
jgi:glycosyltransferase involved in cell wall biosynthesis